MPQKTLLNLILAVSYLGLTLGCHHPALKPQIERGDPTKEIAAPDTTLEEEQEEYRDTAKKAEAAKQQQPPAQADSDPKRKHKISEAKIPASCVTDLDQSKSDCKLVLDHPDLARCNGVVIHFGCLSYRNQLKAVDALK